MLPFKRDRCSSAGTAVSQDTDGDRNTCPAGITFGLPPPVPCSVNLVIALKHSLAGGSGLSHGTSQHPNSRAGGPGNAWLSKG